MNNNILKKSALEKLEKLGLTKDEVLALVEVDEEETFTMEDEPSAEFSQGKIWQQIVLEEHLTYYNNRYGTNHTFEEYYDGIVDEKIMVHYNWKKLLGLEGEEEVEPSPGVKTKKFYEHGHR
jgi:hypothetical protein|tara:strand:+ start:1174 stop:1539 length:366 start_codon:yes stop_codon:yes gene_type:complete